MNFLCVGLFGLLGMVFPILLIPLIRRKAGAKAAEGGRMFHHAHGAPVPRFGGLALAVSLVAVGLVSYVLFPGGAPLFRSRLIILSGSLAMFGLGFWDDLRPLGAKKKLAGQLLIAVAIYAAGSRIALVKNPLTGIEYHLGGWGVFVTVAWLVALTNLVNLIDGIDGLAAGVGLMMMCLLTYAGGGADPFPMCLSAGMAGALLGFLFFNFPPARIFLGDGGAYLIGSLIGILTMENSQKGTVAGVLIAPLFALALPIADVTLAILRRGLRGLPIFRPDRRHLHHRLLASGFSSTQTVLILYGISLVFLLMALGILWTQGRWLPILFGFLCLTLIISARSFEFSREWFSVGRVLGNSLEMRKETQYALTLGRWLELEAGRCKSLADLWTEFQFVVRKLGFARVKLIWNNEERVWEAPSEHSGSEAFYRCRHELQLGGGMILEIAADVGVMSSNLFDHLADIAAEAWHNAAAHLLKYHPQPGELNLTSNPKRPALPRAADA